MPDNVDKFIEYYWLEDVGASAQTVGAQDVLVAVAGGAYNDRQMTQQGDLCFGSKAILGWLIAAAADDNLFDCHVFHRAIAKIARHIADGDDDFLAFDDFAKDAVLIVEKRRRLMRDEKLAAVGIRPGVSHRQDAGLGMFEIGMELIFEAIARATGAVAQRITPLNHETRNHPMKNCSVVERLFDLFFGFRVAPLFRAVGEADEVGDGLGRLVFKELDDDIAHAGFEGRIDGAFLILSVSVKR